MDTQFVFSHMTRRTLQAVSARRGERILDVGCGRGLDLASQKESGAELWGFDGSLVMIHRAKETFASNGMRKRLSCGSAENLPFRDSTFDKVYCKGAIDHFYDPSRAIREMTRVLRPGGLLVISVANFNSLSCRVGRLVNALYMALSGRELPGPHIWEIPEDHTHRFHREFLLGLLPEGIELELERGVSLLWGFPKWGSLLGRLPTGLSKAILKMLDRVASRLPALADIIIIRARRTG
jgi:ubiquinone/menaquinone biosynthesis C-methylase UbiE